MLTYQKHDLVSVPRLYVRSIMVIDFFVFLIDTLIFCFIIVKSFLNTYVTLSISSQCLARLFHLMHALCFSSWLLGFFVCCAFSYLISWNGHLEFFCYLMQWELNYYLWDPTIRFNYALPYCFQVAPLCKVKNLVAQPVTSPLYTLKM